VFVVGFLFIGVAVVAYLIKKQYDIDQEDYDWRQ
jgi:hypothetical protein